MIPRDLTIRLLLIPALAGFLTAGRGYCQTEDGGVEGIFSFGTGADMVGRGQAGAARPSESSALFWNPAYLDRISVANASFFHTSFLGDTPYDFFAVTYPTLHIGTFGAGMFRVSTGDIQGTDQFGINTRNFSYSQYRYLFSYGKNTDFLVNNSALGLSLKIDHQQMFNESATGLGIDLAYHQLLDDYHPWFEGLDFGFVVRNLLPPSMKLFREKDSISRSLIFGVARSFELMKGHTLTPVFDLEKNTKRYWKQRLGFTYDYQSFIRFRMGFNSESIAFGMGLVYRKFQFDYALRNSDYMTNHLISLSYEFGKTKEEMRREEIEAEQARIEQEASERLTRQREEEIARRISEAERLTRDGDYFAALGQWQGVLAWDENNQRALEAIESITEELNRQEQQKNLDIATQAAVRELFETGIHNYTQKKYNEAISSWKRVLEIDPEHSLSREYIERATAELGDVIKEHLDRAAAYDRVGDYASSLNELHKALRYDSENPDIQMKINRSEKRIRSNDRFRRGLDAYLAENYESALNDFKQAQHLNPANALIAEYIGLAESKMAGVTTEIQPEMEKLYLEGVDLYLQGKYTEAIEVWEKILDKDPYNAKVKRNIDEAKQRIETLKTLKNK